MPSFSAVIWILPRCQNFDLLVHIPTRRFHSVSLDWAGCRPLVHNKWKTKKRTQRTVFKFIRSICHSFNRWELNYKSRLEFKVHVKRNKDVLRHKALKAGPTKYREAKTSILSSCNFLWRRRLYPQDLRPPFFFNCNWKHFFLQRIR